MDKSHSLNSPMIVRSLEVNKNLFCSKEGNEKLFGSKESYLSVISALMYFANFTRPNIVFFVNLLTKYNYVIIRRHQNEIKHILYYLHEQVT